MHFLSLFQWSERRRFEIAGLLSSVLRAHLHAYDPIFSMTLRYLIRYLLLFFHNNVLHLLGYIFVLNEFKIKSLGMSPCFHAVYKFVLTHILV